MEDKIVILEINLNQTEVISEIKNLFKECDYYERHSLDGNEIAVIITSISGLLTVFLNSNILEQWIKRNIIKIKIDDIEYEGLVNNIPDFLKKKIEHNE